MSANDPKRTLGGIQNTTGFGTLVNGGHGAEPTERVVHENDCRQISGYSRICQVITGFVGIIFSGNFCHLLAISGRSGSANLMSANDPKRP